MKVIAMVSSSASKLNTVIQTLSKMCRLPDQGSNALSGVRSRNIDPCAKRMKISGQRDISRSSRSRQTS